jgi:hypothetical protein
MLRAIGVGLFVFITHPLLVNSGLYPAGLGWGILYGVGAVGFLSVVGGRNG